MNGRFMRELPLDDYAAAVAATSSATARRRSADRRALRAACEIVQEKAQTLAEVWPLIGFLFERPGRRPEGLGEGDDARGAAAARGARWRRCATREPFDAETLEAALRAVVERRGVEAEAGLPADPRRDHRRAPSRRGSSSRSRRSAASALWSASTPLAPASRTDRRPAWAAAGADPLIKRAELPIYGVNRASRGRMPMRNRR